MTTCWKCAAPARTIVVEHDGIEIASGSLCDACLATAEAGLEVWREQFNALIAAGVERSLANDIIIQRMNAEGATA